MSIRFTDKPEEANAITHAGNFHADDIFSMIILEKILGDLIVFRTETNMPNKAKFNSNAILFDVGFGKYDHHQKNGNGFHFSNNTALNPIPYASFGLLWREFGLEICNKVSNTDTYLSQKLQDDMEQLLVIGVDAIDNGIYPLFLGEYSLNRVTTISNLISLLNPINSEENEIASLEKATCVARFVFNVCMNMLLCKETNPQYSIKNNPKYFLAEQIFTIALLKQIYPGHNFDIDNLDTDLMSIGIKTTEFDSNYSLFGNVWEKVGKEYCDNFLTDKNYPDYIWNYTKNSLVLGIDASSRNITPYNNAKFVNYNIFTISDFINALNPFEYSERAYKKAIKTAIKFSKLIIKRTVLEATERLKSRNYVEQEILKSTLKNQDVFKESSKHILIFDRHVHWKEWVVKSKISKNLWFVISPSNKGGYIIQPIPCKYHMNGWRKGFPKSWHGLNGKTLQRVSKVPTATFVHTSNGFIAGASDLKGAVMLAKNSFSNKECARIAR